MNDPASVTTSASDLTEREQAEQHLQRLQEAQGERESAAYEQSLQPTGLTGGQGSGSRPSRRFASAKGA